MFYVNFRASKIICPYNDDNIVKINTENCHLFGQNIFLQHRY